MKKMQYVMYIYKNYARAEVKGFESGTTMPVSYAFSHMQEVTKIGKSEGVKIEWQVIFMNV